MPVNVKAEPPDRSFDTHSQPYHSTNQSSMYFHGRSQLMQQRPPPTHPAQLQPRLPPPYPGMNNYRPRQGAPMTSQSQSHLAGTGSSQIRQQQPNEKTTLESTENQIDSQSAKGVFGWTTVDDVSVPFLFRDEKKFVSVRMVEMKLLSKYPSSYPEELKDRPPLMSHYITANEAKLLNEINIDHCDYDYGRQPFTQSDLIVKLTDFEEFYSIVKKHFPEEVLKQINKSKVPLQLSRIQGGWLQVNNTVVPYVLKNNTRFVPLSVIKYAAGLLTNVSVEGTKPSEEECAHLNEQCKRAGLNFFFGKTTKMITLDTVASRSKPAITELPKDDPFRYAQYRNMPDAVAMSSSSMSIPNTVSMLQSNAATTRAVNPGLGPTSRQSGPSLGQQLVNNNISTGFPTGTVTSERFPYGHPFWMGQHMGFYPPTNGYPNSMNAVPAQGHRMPPPPYNFQLGPHQNNPNGSGHTPYSRPENMQDPTASMPNNQGAMDGRGPPNRTMTVDMNSHLQRTRRASNESTGSAPSRPGSAVRASPSTSNGSPNQQAPSAALGANPVRSPLGYQQQGPGVRLPAMGVPPRMIPPTGWRQPDPQSMAAMYSRASVSPSMQMLPAAAGVQPVSNRPASPAVSLNHTDQIQSGNHAISIANNQVPVQLQRPTSASQCVSPNALSGRQTPLATSFPQVKNADKEVITNKPPQSSDDLQDKENPVNRCQSAGVQQTVLDSRKQRSSTESPSNPSSKSPSLASSTPLAGKQNNSSQAQAPTVTVAQNSALLLIKPLEFQGKTISCMIKDNESYALVEAISRVYFSHCTLQEFLYALESVLSVPVVTLTAEEERTFIQFYKLPTNVLMCNKVVKLRDFENYLAQLRYMFKPKETAQKAGSANPTASAAGDDIAESVRIPDHVKDDASGVVHAGSLVANSSGGPVTAQVTSAGTVDAGALLHAGMKRPAADTLQHSSLPKQPAGKLEDMVNRLKQKTVPGTEPGTPETQSTTTEATEGADITQSSVTTESEQVGSVKSSTFESDAVICLD